MEKIINSNFRKYNTFKGKEGEIMLQKLNPNIDWIAILEFENKKWYLEKERKVGIFDFAVYLSEKEWIKKYEK